MAPRAPRKFNSLGHPPRRDSSDLACAALLGRCGDVGPGRCG